MEYNPKINLSILSAIAQRTKRSKVRLWFIMNKWELENLSRFVPKSSVKTIWNNP